MILRAMSEPKSTPSRTISLPSGSLLSGLLLDGGDFTPPFTYLIVPSHLTLLANGTGQNKIFIPARDLVGLAIGDVQVATDVLDTEVILENGQLAQDVTFETRQNRLWSLEP
jgi:hypothetical protein